MELFLAGVCVGVAVTPVYCMWAYGVYAILCRVFPAISKRGGQ